MGECNMLELKNLSFSVEENGKQKEILHDLNLSIDNSKFVVITGPNGSGKSTLAKLIMGIEKPTSGQILFDGEDITRLSITERAKRGISFAFGRNDRRFFMLMPTCFQVTSRFRDFIRTRKY